MSDLPPGQLHMSEHTVAIMFDSWPLSCTVYLYTDVCTYAVSPPPILHLKVRFCPNVTLRGLTSLRNSGRRKVTTPYCVFFKWMLSLKHVIYTHILTNICLEISFIYLLYIHINAFQLVALSFFPTYFHRCDFPHIFISFHFKSYLTAS